MVKKEARKVVLKDAQGGYLVPVIDPADKGGSGNYTPNLLDTKWSDHILNDIRWLRGDTFSWQSGDLYEGVYNLLLGEYNNTASTEQTENGITFKVTPRGFRIADSTQEQAILNLYNTTGVAWYYILDTTNTRFKLPRTKYGFAGLRDSVGGYIPESLPNITGRIAGQGDRTGFQSASGAFYKSGVITGSGAADKYDDSCQIAVEFNASRSSSTYKDNAPVQQRATQMYLYFYVGEYTQTAIEQTAGLNAELFNGKVDIDLNNLSTIGQAKFQFAPFSINNGTVANGENKTLYTPTEPSIINAQWTQPVLSSNGTTGTSAVAITEAVFNSPDAYKVFNGTINDFCASNWKNLDFRIYVDVGIKVSAISLRNGGHYATTGGIFYVSDNGIDWTQIGTFSQALSDSSYSTFNVTVTGYHKYYRILLNKATTYSNGNRHVSCGGIKLTATYQQTIHTGTSIICNPCTITTADGRTKAFTTSTTLYCSTLADGTYKVLKDYETGALSTISNLIIAKVEPTSPSSGVYWLDTSVNPLSLKIYNGSAWVIDNNKVYLGDVTVASGAITNVYNNSFNSYYNELCAGLGMPSSRYIDLTLGASGTTYTAPANGWLCLVKQTNNSNQYVQFNATNSGLGYRNNILTGQEVYNTGALAYTCMPMLKGQSTEVFYSAGGTTYAFRFIYAEGAQ